VTYSQHTICSDIRDIACPAPNCILIGTRH